jgi:hypothetical protein
MYVTSSPCSLLRHLSRKPKSVGCFLPAMYTNTWQLINIPQGLRLYSSPLPGPTPHTIHKSSRKSPRTLLFSFSLSLCGGRSLFLFFLFFSSFLPSCSHLCMHACENLSMSPFMHRDVVYLCFSLSLFLSCRITTERY